MMTKDTAIQAFVKLYFDAEASALNKETGTAKFDEQQKATFAAQMRHLKAEFGVPRRQLVLAIAAADSKDGKTDRHEWRLNNWSKTHPEPAKIVEKVAAKSVAAKPAAKPATKAPAIGTAPTTTPVSTAGDMKTFCNNLKQTIKSVCRSGLKNNLTTAEIQNVLGIALKEAGEEFRVEQNQMKFTAFLHTNNIDKNTALDILQRL